MLKENNPTKSAPQSGMAWGKQLAAWALVFAAALPLEARAYTDPGTGAFLLQMALAAIASSLFFMRTLRQRIATLFKRNRNSATEDGGAGDNQLND